MFTSPRTFSAAVLLMLLILLAGCAGITSSPGQDDSEITAFIVSPTTGAPELPAGELDAELGRLDSKGDRLVVVVADGEPFVAIDLTVPKLPGNSDDRDETLMRLRAQAATAVLSQTARTPETDVTEAVALAAQAATPGSRMTIIITGSGLQTAGALSMLDGRLYAEPADLVASAAEQGAVPDLSAVAEVRMPRLGVTNPPQPAADEEARTALSGIWAEYWARAGVGSVALTPTDLRAGEPVTGAPTVTPVAIDRPGLPPVAQCTQVLGASTIGFAAGSAELVDPAGTAALVDEARTRLAGCDGPWLVEGSASSEGDHNRELSLARAEAIAALLRAAEPGAEIQTIGWGDQWACRTPDLDANGALLLTAAISNRVVAISRGEASCT